MLVLEVDLDGSGEDYGYQAMVIFENTSVNDFSADNFDPPYAPDGSAPVGQIIFEVKRAKL